jgi:murein DD-endopeptidase MepM/ murein hydrolase activator NlpD
MKFKRVAGIIYLVLGTAGIILFSTLKTTNETPSPEPEYKEEIIPNMAYGIVIDSMVIYKDKLKRNQFLADILLKYDVDYQKIDYLIKNSNKEVFDVRKMRAGNNYTILCSKDSIPNVEYFVYEDSPTSYVVFDLRDSVHMHKGEKEIEIRQKTTSGIIETSLWNAMVENETNPNLANELSEIYAWAIDFFGIQKGDSYKVIYDELYVDDKNVGIGKVHAALFKHANHEYYAFYFVQNSVGDYFDDKANSMRRTFLKAPLRFKRISSRYSHSRMHPILKVRRPHHGVDYAAAYGTPVHAIGDGIVTFAARKGPNGKMVKIKHNGTYTTAYLHLSKYGKGIKRGVHVKQGDVIGYVGSTGRSTGPHLDFRFYRNGKPVDPLKVKSPPAKPVDTTYLADYYPMVEKFKFQLEHIQVDEELAMKNR